MSRNGRNPTKSPFDGISSTQVAGAGSHTLRVADVGGPLRDILFRQWARRLRRAAARIPTNEYADSDAPHAEYVATRGKPAEARRASIQRRASLQPKDELAGIGAFLARNR